MEISVLRFGGRREKCGGRKKKIALALRFSIRRWNVWERVCIRSRNNLSESKLGVEIGVGAPWATRSLFCITSSAARCREIYNRGQSSRSDPWALPLQLPTSGPSTPLYSEVHRPRRTRFEDTSSPLFSSPDSTERGTRQFFSFSRSFYSRAQRISRQPFFPQTFAKSTGQTRARRGQKLSVKIGPTVYIASGYRRTKRER